MVDDVGKHVPAPFPAATRIPFVHVVLVPATSAAIGLKHVVYRSSLHATSTENQVLYCPGKQPTFSPSAFAAIRAACRSLENDHRLSFLDRPARPDTSRRRLLVQPRTDENTVPLVVPMSGSVDMFQIRQRALKNTPFGGQVFPQRFSMHDLNIRT